MQGFSFFLAVLNFPAALCSVQYQWPGCQLQIDVDQVCWSKENNTGAVNPGNIGE